MIYLLIIFVIALALAPLSYVVPSKRQRKIARMREYAAVHGLFVEFRSLPGASQRQLPRGDIIYYGKRLPARRKVEVKPRSFIRDEEGWRGLERRDSVPALLLELPADILAASLDEGSCGIYWQESSDEENVACIQLVLNRWCEELRA